MRIVSFNRTVRVVGSEFYVRVNIVLENLASMHHDVQYTVPGRALGTFELRTS